MPELISNPLPDNAILTFGKGEVESSILSGGTSFSLQNKGVRQLSGKVKSRQTPYIRVFAREQT